MYAALLYNREHTRTSQQHVLQHCEQPACEAQQGSAAQLLCAHTDSRLLKHAASLGPTCAMHFLCQPVTRPYWHLLTLVLAPQWREQAVRKLGNSHTDTQQRPAQGNHTCAAAPGPCPPPQGARCAKRRVSCTTQVLQVSHQLCHMANVIVKSHWASSSKDLTGN